MQHRNELLLTGDHYMLRTIKQEQKRTAQNTPFPTVTDLFQRRLNQRFRKLTHGSDQKALWKGGEKDMFVKENVRSSRDAELISKEIACGKWRKVHGITEKRETGVVETAKIMYETVDFDESGRVPVSKLVWLLLALGVRMDAEDLTTSLSAHCKDSHQIMHLPQWIGYLNDHFPIITILQRKLSPGMETWDTGLSDIEAFVRETEGEFQRLSVIWEEIMGLWRHMDPLNTQKTSMKRAAEALVELKVTMEVRPAVKLLSRVCSHSSFTSKPEFLSLFLRPLLHLHLDCISKAMVRHWHSDLRFRQKLSEVTRLNIMSGLLFRRKKSRYGSLAVQRLQHITSSSVSYEEFKGRTGKTQTPDLKAHSHSQSYDSQVELDRFVSQRTPFPGVNIYL